MENDYSYSNHRSNKDAGKGLGVLLGALISIVYYLFVYSPIFVIAYLSADYLKDTYSDSLKIKIPLIVLLAYLIYCLVFFLKGILICLKIYKNYLWVFVLILCILLTCLPPTTMAYTLIFNWLSSSQGKEITFQQGWSIGMALLIGWYIYSRYQFHANDSPKISFWAYSLGFKTVENILK